MSFHMIQVPKCYQWSIRTYRMLHSLLLLIPLAPGNVGFGPFCLRAFAHSLPSTFVALVRGSVWIILFLPQVFAQIQLSP